MGKIFAAAIGLVAMCSTCTSLAMEPKEIVEEFFGKLRAGDVPAAYDFLFAGSGIPEQKPQAIDMLKSQTVTVLPLYGKILGEDLVRDEKFGTALVRLVYVFKQEKSPTVWQFYFYKPNDKWLISAVAFNDQFQGLEKKE